MNERMSIGAGVATGFPELFEFCSSLMLEDGPAIDDRSVRAKLAHWAVRAIGLKYTSMRAISALSKGERPGPENSIGKLVAGSMIQDVAAYALDLQGAAGVLSGPEDAEAAGKFQAMLLRAPGTRVEGGTDEIMRNIIAERVLGLPGDIRVDKDVPFNKIPTGKTCPNRCAFLRCSAEPGPTATRKGGPRLSSASLRSALRPGTLRR